MTGIFRDLSEPEIEEFTEWAISHFDPIFPINPLWHPVVRYAWAKLLENYARSIRFGAEKELKQHDGSTLQD
jgi:hypothetical protein